MNTSVPLLLSFVIIFVLFTFQIMNLVFSSIKLCRPNVLCAHIWLQLIWIKRNYIRPMNLFNLRAVAQFDCRLPIDDCIQILSRNKLLQCFIGHCWLLSVKCLFLNVSVRTMELIHLLFFECAKYFHSRQLFKSFQWNRKTETAVEVNVLPNCGNISLPTQCGLFI